jgi:hypothetical protein
MPLHTDGRSALIAKVGRMKVLVRTFNINFTTLPFPAMSRSYILLTCSTIPFLVLYQQHRRLARLYPTTPVPQHLDVAQRSDKPAVGMDPASGESWRPYQASDAWHVDIPRTAFRQQQHSGKAREVEVEPVVTFARAFWGSWPLVLEKRIMQALIGLGIGPFAFRQGSYVCPAIEENDFRPGTGLVGNLVCLVRMLERLRGLMCYPPTVHRRGPRHAPSYTLVYP